MSLIEKKVREAEAAKLDLENNKMNLERELQLKQMSLDIDQSKCLTLRLNFPFTIKCSIATKFGSLDRRRFRLPEH